MSATILQGDCREVLRSLPADSVHCVVTSPPYWGLRDYGVLGQIGREASFWDFLEEMVSVFREVRRVLRPDGVAFINMGDCYAGSWGAQSRGQASNVSVISADQVKAAQIRPSGAGSRSRTGLKPKDLVGQPWRLAFALQDDGWWLRQDIIWHKPNPMPESIADRCTKAHEYLFLLAKSARYYFDAEAIKEGASDDLRRPYGSPGANSLDPRAQPQGAGKPRKIKMPDGCDTGPGGHGSFHRQGREKGKTRKIELANGFRGGSYVGGEPGPRTKTGNIYAPDGFRRNKRSVWTIATEAFPEAHFATFPPALVEPCILVGTSERGCCPSCGAPWARIVEKREPIREWQQACGGDVNGKYAGSATKDFTSAGAQNASAVKARILEGMRERVTTGWQPTCACPAHDPIPCTVLDPFGWSGTTGLVADRLGRDSILIELNPEYAEMARRRIDLDKVGRNERRIARAKLRQEPPKEGLLAMMDGEHP